MCRGLVFFFSLIDFPNDFWNILFVYLYIRFIIDQHTRFLNENNLYSTVLSELWQRLMEFTTSDFVLRYEWNWPQT